MTGKLANLRLLSESTRKKSASLRASKEGAKGGNKDEKNVKIQTKLRGLKNNLREYS